MALARGPDSPRLGQRLSAAAPSVSSLSIYHHFVRASSCSSPLRRVLAMRTMTLRPRRDSFSWYDDAAILRRTARRGRPVRTPTFRGVNVTGGTSCPRPVPCLLHRVSQPSVESHPVGGAHRAVPHRQRPGEVHRSAVHALSRTLSEIGEDRDNWVVVLTGTGDRFMTEIDGTWRSPRAGESAGGWPRVPS